MPESPTDPERLAGLLKTMCLGRETSSRAVAVLTESSVMLRSLAARIQELEAALQAERLKRQEAELMGECTVMLRDDLIAAGVVDAKVAPMFLTEAVLAKVRTLEAERDAAVLAEREAISSMVEQMTYRSRWAEAGTTGREVQPCTLAAAIRARAGTTETGGAEHG